MSEQKLIDAGAECVCGDLVLDRVTVGRYRNGQFILTDDGALKLLDMAEPLVSVATASQPRKQSKVKAKDVSPEAPVEPDTPVADE